MSSDGWTEPLENPFANPPKGGKSGSAAAPPPPPVPGTVDEADPSAVTITTEDAAPAPPARASRGSKTGGARAVPPPPVPSREEAPSAIETAPIAAAEGEEAVADADAPEWLRSASKKEATPAVKAPVRKGCFWACLRCCGRTHRGIVHSSCCTNVFLSLSTVLLFSFFVVSCIFLRERVQAGNCTAPSALCPMGGFADKNCMSFGVVGQQCDSVCDWAAANNAAPFAFTVSGFSGATGSFLEGFVYCPFPKMNSNWRIPLTFFSTVVGIVAIVALCKRFLRTLMVSAALIFFAGGVFFWVMVIDSASIDKSSKACDSKFASFAPGLKNSPITCVMQPYVAIALIDAWLCVSLLYLGLVLWHVYKRFLREAKEAAEIEARKPPSERLTEAEKRQMFSKGDEEEGSSSSSGGGGPPLGGGSGSRRGSSDKGKGAGSSAAANIPSFE